MVSVIIPAYNSAELVVQAIDSALAQTVPPGEVIVIDDGSTDDTAERVARYGAVVRYVRQENRGVAAARNHGLRLARGEFIAFLDADDVWERTKLELQLECLRNHPEIGLLGTGVYPLWHGRPARAQAAGTGEAPVPRGRPLERIDLRRLLVRNYFTTSSILARRDIIGRAGEFDTQLQGPEDYDLWLRIAELTQAAILTEPLTGYRDVPGSLSKNPAAMEAGMRRILEKLDERGAWRSAAPAAVWRRLRWKAYSYAHYSWAYMYSAAGMRERAARNLARSLMLYPLPYKRAEVSMPLARLRMLGILLRGTKTGKAPEARFQAPGNSPLSDLKRKARTRCRLESAIWSLFGTWNLGERQFRATAKRLARAVLRFHIPVGPVTRPLFAALYRGHVLGREAGIWALRFFWYEPLFRSQCADVGPGFWMEKLPYIVGRGRIVIGEGVRLSGKPAMAFCNRLHAAPELIVGDQTFIGHGCSFNVAASVRIGSHCLIAGGVSVRDWDGHPADARQRVAGQMVDAALVRPVVIEDHVWVGTGARILKGVRIGARSIVGAGAVVTRDVPPDTVVAGNPARIVKSPAETQEARISAAA